MCVNRIDSSNREFCIGPCGAINPTELKNPRRDRLSEIRLANGLRIHRGLDPSATVDPKFVNILN